MSMSDITIKDFRDTIPRGRFGYLIGVTEFLITILLLLSHKLNGYYAMP